MFVVTLSTRLRGDHESVGSKPQKVVLDTFEEHQRDIGLRIDIWDCGLVSLFLNDNEGVAVAFSQRGEHSRKELSPAIVNEVGAHPVVTSRRPLERLTGREPKLRTEMLNPPLGLAYNTIRYMEPTKSNHRTRHAVAGWVILSCIVGKE